MSRRTASSRSSGKPARRMSRPSTMRSSGRNPGSTVIRLRSVPMNRSAPTTSTSENAICATTRNRRRPKRSRSAVTPRPLAFMAAPGAMWVARNAGASPNSMQVRRASALVNASTRASGLTSTNRRLASVVRNATRPALSQCASTAPAAAPADRQQHALRHELPHDASARGADGQPHRDLALPRAGAGQHEVGQVGAGDEQHQRGHAEQDPQRLLVVAPEPREPRSAVGGGSSLLAQVLLHRLRLPVGRDRLLEDRGRDRGQLRVRLLAARRPRAAARRRSAATSRSAPARSAGPRRTGDMRTAGRRRRSCARPRSRGSRRRSRPRSGRSCRPGAGCGRRRTGRRPARAARRNG